MTDNTRKPADDLIGDLEAPQPTSAEADLVRGGNIATAVGRIVAYVKPSSCQNEQTQMFQQVMQQVTRGG